MHAEGTTEVSANNGGVSLGDTDSGGGSSTGGKVTAKSVHRLSNESAFPCTNK